MQRRDLKITVVLWSLMAISLAVMIGAGVWKIRHAGMEDDLPQAAPHPVPAFTAVDQNGKNVARADLGGKVWLADFIFTRCAGPCPLMTMKMMQIQQALGEAPVTLVSFTVDPDYDSPQVLKKYMADRGAKENNWLMLNTGSNASVQSLARAMNIGVHKPEEGDIVHGTHFILVDRAGKIAGYFSGVDADGWQRAVDAAKKLTEAR